VTKKFEVLLKGGKPTRPIAKYERAVRRALRRLPSEGPYEWKRRGADEWWTSKSKWTLRKALMARRHDVGDAFYLRKQGREAIHVLRAIDVGPATPDCPDPLATAGVKRLWTAVHEATLAYENQTGHKYDVVFMGIYNCRRIDGSSSWSQHAFRNALDFRLRRTGALAGSIDSAATGFVAYRTRTVAAETLWNVPGHTYHAHLTGEPKRFGTPECA
jgi:hypothetical protein